MNIQQVNSHEELLEFLNKNETSYVLIYKEGSETSECALNNLNELEQKDSLKIFAVNVKKVRDIHTHYNITTAPTVLQFEKDKMLNSIKGCQTKEYYKSLISNSFSVFSNKNGEEKKQKPVTVYSTPSCPWCNRLKQYLKENKIKFRDIDVSKDQKAAEEMVKRSGQQGVPQADIAGQIVIGFDKKKIDQLLNIKS